jgi:hypothetical protein
MGKSSKKARAKEARQALDWIRQQPGVVISSSFDVRSDPWRAKPVATANESLSVWFGVAHNARIESQLNTLQLATSCVALARPRIALDPTVIGAVGRSSKCRKPLPWPE